MYSVTPEKLEKLEKHLHRLIADLKQQNHLHIHQAINEFYYMQKAEELQILQVKLSDEIIAFELLLEKIRKHYEEVFCKWRTDRQWLQHQLVLDRERFL